MSRPVFEIKEYDNCPHCKTGQVIVKTGKFGNFYGCSRFPSCAFTQPIPEDDEINHEIIDTFSLQDREEVEDCGLVFN